jgi:hypothetical protein
MNTMEISVRSLIASLQVVRYLTAFNSNFIQMLIKAGKKSKFSAIYFKTERTHLFGMNHPRDDDSPRDW